MALVPTYRQTAQQPKKIRRPQAVTPVNQNVAAPPAPHAPGVGGITRTGAPARAALTQTLGENVPHPAPTAKTPMTTVVTPDPKDAQYFAQLAKLQFQRNQGTQQLETQQAVDDQSLQRALEARSRRLPEDRTGARNTANKAGLFYSGALGKQLGEIDTQYATDVADTNRTYTQNSAARAAARKALEEGYTIDEATAMAEAIGRQEARDAANPTAPVEQSLAQAGIPLSSPAINPATNETQIMGSLHSLNQQSKSARTPQDLKNLAIYWNTLTQQLRTMGQNVPAPSSKLKKYL